MAESKLMLEPRGLMSWFGRDPFALLRGDADNLFGRWFGNGESWTAAVPAIDLSENETNLLLRMDIPGVQAKDIEIQLTGNLLTISGEQKDEREEKGKTWHRLERRCGRFSRSIQLPCAVEDPSIDAQFKDGVLTITMPKTKEARAQKIKVKG